MKLPHRWTQRLLLLVVVLLHPASTSCRGTPTRTQLTIPEDVDVSNCLLWFGAFCNGNMGDVAQVASITRLMSHLEQCIWFAHPAKEEPTRGFHEGWFFGDDESRVISLTCSAESGRVVSRFKGFIIGGGGLFEAQHYPLHCSEFVASIDQDLPIAIFGVGASTGAAFSADIVRRADFVSGRDGKSVAALSTLLRSLEGVRVPPSQVRVVRDPVLSDQYLTDTNGSCWKERLGQEKGKQLCFVLPSASQDSLQMLHEVFSSQVVRHYDLVFNVFPKHQQEIEAYDYPAKIHAVLDPLVLLPKLCGCRAVISSRLHGAILGLHSGIPTIAAWPSDEGNKIPALMKDVMRLPQQFLLVNESLTRHDLNKRVSVLRDEYRRSRYPGGCRRQIFWLLDKIFWRTKRDLYVMLGEVFHLDLGEGPPYDPERKAPSEARNRRNNVWKDLREQRLSVSSSDFEDFAPDQAGATFAHGDQGEDAVEALHTPEDNQQEEEEKEQQQQQGQDEQEKPGARAHVDVNTSIIMWAINGDMQEGEATARHAGGGVSEVNEADKILDESTGVTSWKRRWGMNSVPVDPAIGPPQAFVRDTPIMTLVILVLIGMLSIPVLSTWSKGNTPSTPPGAEASCKQVGGTTTWSWSFRGKSPEHPAITRVTFLGLNYILWIVLSVGYNAYSKTYLRMTTNPVALLAIQGWVGVAVLLSMGVFGGQLCPWAFLRVTPSPASSGPRPSHLSSLSWRMCAGLGPGRLGETRNTYRNLCQAGLLHCINAVLTSWSVLVGGIAVTHALKALEPVAAMALSRWLLGVKLRPEKLAAVAVIVVGWVTVMVPWQSSWWSAEGQQAGSEGTIADEARGKAFDMLIPGMMTTCACCAVALRNVLIKRIEPSPQPPVSLFVCSVLAAIVGSAFLLMPWLPCSWEWGRQPLLLSSGFNASLCFVGYNLASFNLLTELSPIGHSVGNVSKRICLFVTGLAFGERALMATHQVVGALTAFAGLAGYNLVAARRLPQPIEEP